MKPNLGKEFIVKLSLKRATIPKQTLKKGTLWEQKVLYGKEEYLLSLIQQIGEAI